MARHVATARTAAACVAWLAVLFSAVEGFPAGAHKAGVAVATRSANTGSWRGGFEVHVFQVGQGDSQLIVFPSGFSMLIDVHEASWNTCKGARTIAEKVHAVLGHTHVNVGTPSHWHLDHLGYAGYGGFWCLIEEGLMTFDSIVDRDGALTVPSV